MNAALCAHCAITACGIFIIFFFFRFCSMKLKGKASELSFHLGKRPANNQAAQMNIHWTFQTHTSSLAFQVLFYTRTSCPVVHSSSKTDSWSLLQWHWQFHMHTHTHTQNPCLPLDTIQWQRSGTLHIFIITEDNTSLYSHSSTSTSEYLLSIHKNKVVQHPNSSLWNIFSLFIFHRFNSASLDTNIYLN